MPIIANHTAASTTKSGAAHSSETEVDSKDNSLKTHMIGEEAQVTGTLVKVAGSEVSRGPKTYVHHEESVSDGFAAIAMFGQFAMTSLTQKKSAHKSQPVSVASSASAAAESAPAQGYSNIFAEVNDTTKLPIMSGQSTATNVVIVKTGTPAPAHKP